MRVRLASEAECEARSRLTAPVWGDRLTVDQYLARERALADTAFARRALRTWLLVDEADEALASCETYRMAARLHGQPAETQGFASVFVEPRLRRRGLARAMLEGVAARLRDEGAHAAHLFSEVGTSLYESVGFHARPIAARSWTPVAEPVRSVAEPFDRAQAARVLADRLPLGAAPDAPFRIVLDHDQLEWHRARASVYHRFLGGGRPSPDTLAGAVAGDGWIAWFADYRLDRLLTLAVRPGSGSAAAALVEATRRAAAALGLPVAEHWESPATPLPGGEARPLDDEIPMLLPFAPGLAPGHWLEYGRGCWI